MTQPRSLRRIAPLAFAVALGALGYLAGGHIGRAIRATGTTGGRLDLDAWQVATLVGTCLLATIFVLLFHELGHLAGGRLVGFRAFLLIVGPLRLERGEQRWHWHLNTDPALAGGLAGTAPTEPMNLRGRSAVMIASGPLASALLGAVAAAGWWLTEPFHLGPATPFPQVLAAFSLMLVGGVSTAIALATLLPIRVSGFLSDGARLLQLRHGGAVAERDLAIQVLTGMSLAGTRPRDWSPALLATALVPTDGSLFEVVAWQLNQAHAADSGRQADARRWLDQVLAHLDRLPASLRPATQCDAARQLALWGALPEAKAQLAAAQGPLLGAPYLRKLAEAAVLVADGQVAAGRALLPAARAELAAGIDRGGAKWLADTIDALERDVPRRQ